MISNQIIFLEINIIKNPRNNDRCFAITYDSLKYVPSYGSVQETYPSRNRIQNKKIVKWIACFGKTLRRKKAFISIKSFRVRSPWSGYTQKNARCLHTNDVNASSILRPTGREHSNVFVWVYACTWIYECIYADTIHKMVVFPFVHQREIRRRHRFD